MNLSIEAIDILIRICMFIDMSMFKHLWNIVLYIMFPFYVVRREPQQL